MEPNKREITLPFLSITDLETTYFFGEEKFVAVDGVSIDLEEGVTILIASMLLRKEPSEPGGSSGRVLCAVCLPEMQQK